MFRGEPCGPLFRICRLVPRRVRRVPVRVPAAFQHGIVLVKTPLFPRGEFPPAERPVRHVRAHEPIKWVVVQHGRDPGLDDGGFTLVGIRPAKIRLVLLDGIARVVVDGASGTDPADIRPAVLLDDGAVLYGPVLAGFRDSLGEHDAARTVRILDGLQPSASRRSVHLAAAGAHVDRRTRIFEAAEIVYKLFGWAVERIALRLPRLAHQGDLRDETEGSPVHCGPVAVRVRDHPRRHVAVVVVGGDDVTHSIRDGLHEP